MNTAANIFHFTNSDSNLEGGGIFSTAGAEVSLIDGSAIMGCYSIWGGGIAVTFGAKVSLLAAHIIDCKALHGGAAYSYHQSSTLTLSKGSVITGCSASEEGGAVLVISLGEARLTGGSIISRCSCDNIGGALAVTNGGDLWMRNSTVLECTAKNGG